MSYSFKPLYPKVVCMNGLTMSVQASQFHYCSPRTNDGPYNSVEVGFPSREVPELLEYAEDPENPTETVYGYVPVELLWEVIQKNGGFDMEAMGRNQKTINAQMMLEGF